MPLWLYAWLIGWGAILGAVLMDAYAKRSQRHARRIAELRVTECTFVDCEPQMLVTINEDDGCSEIRGYCIMPIDVWERIDAGADQ
jgi:hypothetical protein